MEREREREVLYINLFPRILEIFLKMIHLIHIFPLIRRYLGSEYPELGESDQDAVRLRRAEYAEFRAEHSHFGLSEEYQSIDASCAKQSVEIP